MICGIFSALLVLTSSTTILASSNYNYDHVLHLSLLYYEAQRSGYLPADNRIPWRGNSALHDRGINGEDLTGGYYDGKSHVYLVMYQYEYPYVSIKTSRLSY
jgi:hypothetical protein